ncbi:intein C-terminal splicing region [Amycolatopsis marina]|uniref:Intein C-terminal splicing region n=1 Tax=Amycolatopsis marina TaxID=490629 RepID=A0A1I1BIU2_9PSEU|nr:polymorphic toxin-type HINT domain-containing protein [Amycolatopsis marina]SFB48400.1 intein C-terminal splicing region [Amycolatopsis marina]
MNFSAVRRVWVALLAVALLVTLVQQPTAGPRQNLAAELATAQDDSAPRPMPPDPYEEWDGTTGVPDTGDPRLRQLVADNAELAEDVEVREAAAEALKGGRAEILAFLNTGLREAQQRAEARKAETARQNLAAIEPLRGTGGPYLRAEVDRVLAGSDVDRAQFLAYGKEIAEQRDAATTQRAEDLADRNRARVQMLVGAGGPEVKRAAQVALDAGDAAIAQFLATGYLDAARADAAAREQFLADERARQEAAEKLSELAQRSARANEARRVLLIEHGDGVNALQRSSNALILAGNEARRAEQILAANTAGGQHPPDSFNAVKAEVARQLSNAGAAAADARQAAVQAQVQADVLVDTGMPYGTQWAQMAQGMAAAADAAVAAVQTASHAIDATAHTDQARNAQERAERHAEQARKWRTHAEEHAAAAADLAEAARIQAGAAKDAAARTKAARQAAEAAEAEAWAAAERTRQHRVTAEREAEKAAAARAVAERERANAAAARQRAESQAAVARAARGEADTQAAIAASARQRAEAQDGIAAQAETNARAEEGNAAAARDSAHAAERAQRAADARAAAMDAMAAAGRGTAHEATARDAAIAARGDATTARTAAGNARAAANTATGAAAGARGAATEATRAAARARAAAEEARAAAARANAAANQAEAEAAATHAAALRANSAAADATANEAKAAEAARTARNLAQQAAAEAMRSFMAAERTKAEADAAASEAVAAATQADLALRASTAARESSKAITAPADTAVVVVAPFTDDDIGADFVLLVAAQARQVGAEQAAAAQQRATEALEAARLAQEAADRAAAEVKPAYDAAAAASASSAAAARSAAEAQQAAAEAAADGAAARAAAARANQADAQAQEDARLARRAANAAAQDAAIAGRSAAAAEQDAAAARSAASAAEADAAAARNAATRAESDATAAEAAAASAEQHAIAAAEAAKNAFASAVEAGKAADRAEEAARQAEQQRRAEQAANSGDGAGKAELTPEEEELLLAAGGQELLQQYKEAIEAANKGILDFIKENGADILLELIGVEDARKCFGEGDIVSCLWTVVNAGSLLLILAKLPQVGGAIAKVAGGIARFLEKSQTARNLLNRVDNLSDCNCFPAGAPVATSAGAKPIEQVQVGDRVWARSTTTGQPQLRQVVGLFSKKADEILTITAGGVDIQVTPQHPFWAVNRGWVEAGGLKPGDRLESLTGARPMIERITRSAGPTTVYNFEVEGDHNYYISDAQLLVHNCLVNTVYKFMKATDDFYPGTKLPRNFEFELENGLKVWMHPNGTKHIEEFLNGKAVRPELRNVQMHWELGTLRKALSKAYENGAPKFDEIFVSEGWELKIGPPREEGMLPAVYHARWVGKK